MSHYLFSQWRENNNMASSNSPMHVRECKCGTWITGPDKADVDKRFKKHVSKCAKA